MVVAGRLLENGDVAVMMVEAGGTENAWSYYETGAPKVDEKVLAAGLEFAKEPIKQAIALQEKLIESAGEISKMEVTLAVDYSEEIMEAVKEVGSGLLAESQTIADKTQRAEAESQAASSVLEEVLERFDEQDNAETCLLYTSPSPRDRTRSRMPSSA